MKHLFLLLLCISTSCTLQQKKQAKEVKKNATTTLNNDICWSGTLNAKIPVFLHYQVLDSVVIGELTYLNTKAKKPIPVVGTLKNGNYRILEFAKDGNITGILTGTQNTDTNFSGYWFSPKTRKNLSLNLTKSDSIIPSKSNTTVLKNIYGNYRYQYSESGYQGEFSISKVDHKNSAFSIFSVTNAPARNMADVGIDTISLHTTEFLYTIPDTDDCEFKVRFFKDFLQINYTKGFCDGTFGHNATIEGIYYKVKH